MVYALLVVKLVGCLVWLIVTGVVIYSGTYWLAAIKNRRPEIGLLKAIFWVQYRPDYFTEKGQEARKDWLGCYLFIGLILGWLFFAALCISLLVFFGALLWRILR